MKRLNYDSVDFMLEGIEQGSTQVGVIGLGYVGLPLALTICEAGFNVVGLDINPQKIDDLINGRPYIKTVSNERLQAAYQNQISKFTPSINFEYLTSMDIIIIAVPTPLDEYRQPDLSYIDSAVTQVQNHVRRHQLIILESTSYPGTTRERVYLPLVQFTEFNVGQDIFIAFSPERENPGSGTPIKKIPKLVAGLTPNCKKLATAFYTKVFDSVISTSSLEVAETAKILENTYRAVNIALVNEMRYLCEQMGIDIWEVIDAASTKPFGFQRFIPGFVGGHCIACDPTYFTYKVKKFNCKSRLISEAEAINLGQPKYICARICDILIKSNGGISSGILILGITYKPDIDDIRESGVLKLIDLLEDQGFEVFYHDPYIPYLDREKNNRQSLASVDITDPRIMGSFDYIILAVAHKCFNIYQIITDSKQVIDIANATKNIECDNRVWRI